METTADVQRKVAKLYAGKSGGTVNVPSGIMADSFMASANGCMSSALVLKKDGPQHWLQIVQLSGLAIELTLKACFYSVNTAPPKGHDLNSLCRKVERHGFNLGANDAAMIAHLHHHYFEDLDTGTRHKARYPTETDEKLGGAVPGALIIAELIERLQAQAKSKNDCGNAT